MSIILASPYLISKRQKPSSSRRLGGQVIYQSVSPEDPPRQGPEFERAVGAFPGTVVRAQGMVKLGLTTMEFITLPDRMAYRDQTDLRRWQDAWHVGWGRWRQSEVVSESTSRQATLEDRKTLLSGSNPTSISHHRHNQRIHFTAPLDGRTASAQLNRSNLRRLAQPRQRRIQRKHFRHVRVFLDRRCLVRKPLTRRAC